MIVLSLTVGGETRTHSSGRPRVRLGSGADADIRVADAGWRDLEAVLVHFGTEVRCEALDGESWRLRVGDSVRLGAARVTLVGLLPLAETADAPPPTTATTSAAAAAALLFGDYEEAPASAPTFELEAAPERATAHARTAPPTPPPAPSSAAAAPSAAPAPAPPPVPSAPPPPPPTFDPSGPFTRPPGSPRRPAFPAFPTESFGEEVVRQLRRTPYVTVSLVVHVLALLVLSLLHTSPTDDLHERGPGALVTMAELDPYNAEDRGLDADDSDDGSPLPQPELEPIPDIEIPDVPPPPAEVPREELELAPLPEPEGLDIPLGLNPSVRAAGERPRPPVKPATSELARDFSKADKDAVNQRAARIVRTHLGREGGRGDPFGRLEREDLLVVDGSFDKIGRVLHALRLPYVAVTPMSLTFKNAPDLDQHKAIFWNCGESLPPNRVPTVARRIRKFVEEGGYLFTTDWAVATLLMPAFPGYLGTTGPLEPLPETVVDIAPAPGKSTHPLLAGVFHPHVPGRWWLEQASFEVRVLDPRNVETLIVSKDLEAKYHRSPVVAATFRYGKGRVMHVMGHYYQEEGNLAGTITAQRLALNFVLERINRDPLPRGR